MSYVLPMTVKSLRPSVTRRSPSAKPICGGKSPRPRLVKQETYIAIIQSGYAIFGYGIDLPAAISHANENLDKPITEDDLGAEYVDGELFVAEITAALAAEVDMYGGSVSYELLESGIYGTRSESDAEYA